MEAYIHKIDRMHLAGDDIENSSLKIIQELVPREGLSEGEWRVLCRMVHTCGDPCIRESLLFNRDAVQSGVEAMRKKAPIYVDAKMQKAGLSLSRLRTVHPDYQDHDIHCHVSDVDVADKAKQEKLARSLFAVRKAQPILDGAIISIGNAPVALLELNRMILEQNIHPALVIGVPVGFVHVVESKEELLQMPVPSIILTGRRGGSALAVSILHALAIQALQKGN